MTDALFTTPTPVLERRAYMLDISRDRVPTTETLDWLVGVLAALRVNELQLYTEHTFTYTGHEAVWADASAMTHDDMRRLDDVCRAQGIDLVANMNCFGHMGRWLEHDEYRAMAEAPDGAKAIFGDATMPPGCLAPTPENAAFGVALAQEIASVVSHRRIHIGGDEPFELGDGVSAAAVAERGRDHVYLEHLNRIIEPLVAAGHEVMFWADLFRRDPTLMPLIPPGAVGVVWNYEAPSDSSWTSFVPAEVVARLGLPDDAHLGFESHARLFIDSGTPFWVAPGTAGWNTIIGRNLNAAGNIADAVAVGKRHGASGLLLTDWGDNGHWQPLAVSLPSLVRAGVAAWTGEVPGSTQVADAVDELLGAGRGVGSLLDRMGELGEGLGFVCLNGSPIHSAVSGAIPTLGELREEGYREAEKVLAEAVEVFAAPSIGGPRGEVVAAEMRGAVASARIGLARIGAAHGTADREPDATAVDQAVELQREGWLTSSRPGGLADSLAKVARP